MSEPLSCPTGLLATDLDGTLIPLNGDNENERDLIQLSNGLVTSEIGLVFVTGRHLASVEDAIQEFNLPSPGWIICDVGTSIYRFQDEAWEIVPQFEQELQSLLGLASINELDSHLSIFSELRIQESEKQGRYKLSFYSDAVLVNSLREEIVDQLQRSGFAIEVIASVDPFNGDGLIDILPKGVSKAFALNWLAGFNNVQRESIVFAGDSGNDFAAMTAGYKTIVVGNADQHLKDMVRSHHAEKGWLNRLHISGLKASSGVLEGCRHFSIIQ